MDSSLTVLLLADPDRDLGFVLRALSDAGFAVSVNRADSAESYSTRLDDSPDLIIADASFEELGVTQALAVLRERDLDIPFIVVADVASEDRIVECMRAGAADFVSTNQLARLGQAVAGARAACRDRVDRKRAERSIRRRGAVLEAVSHSIYGLLSATDWKDAIQPELARLGAAAGAAGVCILQLGSHGPAETGEHGTGHRANGDSSAGDVASLPESDAVCRASDSMRAILSLGEVRDLAVSELPDHERAFLMRQGIESVLVAPVVACEELWGALAFGRRSESRDWAIPEIGALETAARILGAVVQRERVAMALRQSERTNRAILMAIPDLMFRLGREGVIVGHKTVQINDREIASGSLAGRNIRTVFPDAAPDIEARVTSVLETGRPFLAELVQPSEDPGRLYELRIVRSGDAEALAIARDITDRHRSDQRTRALNAATQLLERAESVPEMISCILCVLGSNLGFDTAAYWAVDSGQNALQFVEMWHRDPTLTGAFETAARDLSMLRGEGVAGRVWDTKGATWIENVAADDAFLMARHAEQAHLETVLAFAVTAGGRVYGVIKLLCRGRRQPDANLIQAAESLGIQIGQFIERKQHERKISESEARFRAMADMAPVLMWVSGVAGECTFANRPWLDFTGRTLAETIATGWMSSIHPDDRARTVEAYRSAVEDRHAYQVEFRVLRHDGDYRWVLNTGVPRFDSGGDFVGYIGSGIDITDKMLVEAELRRERQFVHTLLDTIDIGIVACDAEGDLTLLNRATRAFSRESEVLVTQGDWSGAVDLHHPDAITPLHRDAHPLMRALRGETVRNQEVAVVSDSGDPKMLLASGQRIVGPDGETTGAVVAFQDVTSERLLESQFRQAHKMEAVGRLAGGVAHDFNNILTVITGYGEMLRQRLGEAEHLIPFADEILEASGRAAALTRQLLAFSRKQLLQPRVVDLNALVKNLNKMLGRLIGEDVELIIRLDPTVGHVFADPGQIEQVVINLVVNARDAMPDGGTLVVESSTVELDREAVEGFGDIRPGAYSMISVSDTGCGMSAETMSHIYEPFFTTKGADRGTGLGLATVYGIVRQSNGAIFAESEPGVGSVFKICLPVHSGSEVGLRDAASAESPAARGETILVVEDDRAVRTLVCGALTSAGYTVIEAENGEEALAVCESRDGPLDLVLSDMVMPKMSGRELARRIAEKRPELRILFMSGYTHDILSTEERSRPEMVILEKPFSRRDLARAVRTALDSEPSCSTRGVIDHP